MDRRVKERLVGATILLGLVVVVVPELLSGPKPAATRPPLTLPVPVHSYTVDVTNHSMAPMVPVPAVADTASYAVPSAASAPELAASAARGDAPSTAPLESAGSPPISPRNETNKAVAPSELVAPSASVVPSESVARLTHPSGLAWGLQLGSFASKPNAEKLVRTMSAKGYPATVSAAGSGSALRYRVRIGSLVDREAAERMLVRLKAQGQAATLVPPAP